MSRIPFNEKVSSKFGAPMGRRSDPLSGFGTKPLHLRRVPLTGGGCYDKGGAYWGSPDNLWCVWGESSGTESDEFVAYFRAPSREKAIEKIRAECPHAKFFGEGTGTCKGGLSADRAYEISESIWRADRDAESAAKSFGSTLDQLLARYTANRERIKPSVFAKLPVWVHSKLMAGRRMALDRIHQSEMTWILKVRADGTWVEKWEGLNEEERAEFMANTTQGAHYWTCHLPKLKPFNAGTNPHEIKS